MIRVVHTNMSALKPILPGVNPAPDEGPNSAGDYADDSMDRTGVLKLFDKNQNETNQAGQGDK